ncbi:MAG: helix-turn-helix domain-containing protein [Acidimicrobiales bacterium]
MSSTARGLPAGVHVPLPLTPWVDRALLLLAERSRADWPDEVAEAAALFTSAAAVYRSEMLRKSARAADQQFRDPISVGAAADGTGRRMSTDMTGLRLGVTPARVRQLARAGVLPGRRGPKGWMFAEQDVERLRESRQTS